MCSDKYRRIAKIKGQNERLSLYELQKVESDKLSPHEKWGTFYRKKGDLIETRSEAVTHGTNNEFEKFLFER